VVRAEAVKRKHGPARHTAFGKDCQADRCHTRLTVVDAATASTGDADQILLIARTILEHFSSPHAASTGGH
jgi:hypothetical protein